LRQETRVAVNRSHPAVRAVPPKVHFEPLAAVKRDSPRRIGRSGFSLEELGDHRVFSFHADQNI
jgi:hypothetical protein